jgi:hypothetical protein
LRNCWAVIVEVPWHLEHFRYSDHCRYSSTSTSETACLVNVKTRSCSRVLCVRPRHRSYVHVFLVLLGRDELPRHHVPKGEATMLDYRRVRHVLRGRRHAHDKAVLKGTVRRDSTGQGAHKRFERRRQLERQDI